MAFLDKTGLNYLWSKINDALNTALTGKADTDQIPTKLSQLTNDRGYITSSSESDPTVPSWAKASTKPTYTASEVGAVSQPSGTESSLNGTTPINADTLEGYSADHFASALHDHDDMLTSANFRLVGTTLYITT